MRKAHGIVLASALSLGIGCGGGDGPAEPSTEFGNPGILLGEWVATRAIHTGTGALSNLTFDALGGGAEFTLNVETSGRYRAEWAGFAETGVLDQTGSQVRFRPDVPQCPNEEPVAAVSQSGDTVSVVGPSCVELDGAEPIDETVLDLALVPR